MRKCIRCGEEISAERAAAAYSRGKKPRFDSEACKNAWHQQQRRDEAKKASKA